MLFNPYLYHFTKNQQFKDVEKHLSNDSLYKSAFIKYEKHF